MSTAPQRKLPPIPVLGMGYAVFGLVGGFLVLPLPQMLAAQGVDAYEIAKISGACFSPGFWVFALGPILDIRFSRRAWAGFFAVVAGLAMTAAVALRAKLWMLEGGLIVSYSAANLSSNALGGWLASLVPEDDHGGVFESDVSAWTQVATFLGNGIMAALAGELLPRISALSAGIVLGLLVMLPATLFPFIPLPLHERRLELHQTVGAFTQFWSEIRTLFTRREVLKTLLLFALPTGAFALTNQLGGVAHTFHATDAYVDHMGGLVLSLAGAAACLLVPLLARRVHDLTLYLGIGVVGSLFTLALLVLPRTPISFGVAFLGENVFQAMSFTAAVAICLRVIGRENPLAGTLFGLLTAVTVLPIITMGVVDGKAFALHGLPAMLGIDGGLSVAACLLMALVLFRRSLPSS